MCKETQNTSSAHLLVVHMQTGLKQFIDSVPVIFANFLKDILVRPISFPLQRGDFKSECVSLNAGGRVVKPLSRTKSKCCVHFSNRSLSRQLQCHSLRFTSAVLADAYLPRVRPR